MKVVLGKGDETGETPKVDSETLGHVDVERTKT